MSTSKKAYMLGIRDDPDQGNKIIFATNVREARKEVYKTDFFFDSWIDVQALRCRHYDGMETLSESALALEQWKDGWRWFDHYDVPDPDEDTDERFLEWYNDNFGGKK